MKQLATALGIRQEILFLDAVPRKELHRLLACVDVLVSTTMADSDSDVQGLAVRSFVRWQRYVAWSASCDAPAVVA